MKTDIIKNIEAKNDRSWEDKVFITIDIDWVHDAILEEVVNFIENFDINVTWFVTHQTKLIERLRSNSRFELGIHPNFNFLLSGDFSKGRNSEEVLDSILQIVPEAKSVRSHSMTQNSMLLELFKAKGLTHDCNHFIPYQSNISLRPWELWNGLIKCPYFWEDDLACSFNNLDVNAPIVNDGLKIFDFHPIHLFLNTENLSRYESTRPLHYLPEKLLSHRYAGKGTYDAFVNIVEFTTPSLK
jgi:hypothetical protein